MHFIKNPSSGIPESELLILYKKHGDLNVLADLYQRYMDLVYGVCLKYLEDPESAKDSVLSIYEELITKLRKHVVTNFKGWLYQLTRNHCLMILRSKKNNRKVSIDVSLMQSEETVHLNGEFEKEENFKYMYDCLAQLIPEQKKSLELFYLEKRCYNEIVELTGLEWNKVRSYIQNGRRNLKICMDKQMTN